MSRLPPLPRLPFRPLRLVLGAGLAGLMLAACSGIGGAPGGGGGLAPGLVARMDAPGAALDRDAALGLVNAYRASVGAPALGRDAALDAAAGELAARYATSGTQPRLPAGAAGLRSGAGYLTFADMFSGWRASPPDAAVLALAGARRAGVASVFNANSAHGVYWVLLLDD